MFSIRKTIFGSGVAAALLLVATHAQGQTTFDFAYTVTPDSLSNLVGDRDSLTFQSYSGSLSLALNTPLSGAILNPFTFSIGSGSVTQPLVTGTLLDSIHLTFNDTVLPTATTSQTLQLVEQVTGADGFRVASLTTAAQINFSQNDRDYLLTITPNGGNWVQGQSGGAYNVTATVLLTDVTPIPEPTGIALAGSGLLLIVFIMRGRLGTRLLAPATVKA